jgi:hypothetical protein
MFLEAGAARLRSSAANASIVTPRHCMFEVRGTVGRRLVHPLEPEPSAGFSFGLFLPSEIT